MTTATEYALIVARVVRLAAVPVADRAKPENLAEATAVLAAAKEYAAASPAPLIATAAYQAAVVKTSQWVCGGPCAPQPEPWIAFAAGPGHPPPVTLLLRPGDDAPGLVSSIFATLLSYTGPVMLYTLLVEGKVPSNGLTDAIAATMGGAVAAATENASRFLWVAGAATVAVLLYMRGRK